MQYWILVDDGQEWGVLRVDGPVIELYAPASGGWVDRTELFSEYIWGGERGALKASPEDAAYVLDKLYGATLQEHGNHDQSSHGRRGGGGVEVGDPRTGALSGATIGEVPHEVFTAGMDAFRAKMAAGPKDKDYSAFVSPQTPESLAEMGAKTYVALDGDGNVAGGYYMTDDGYLGGLFSNGAVKDAGRDLVLDGVQHGATSLDCYAGTLDGIYSEFGFKETGRNPWNGDYAPPDWNYKRDNHPDYVDMAWDGGDRSTVADRWQRGQSLQEAERVPVEGSQLRVLLDRLRNERGAEWVDEHMTMLVAQYDFAASIGLADPR